MTNIFKFSGNCFFPEIDNYILHGDFAIILLILQQMAYMIIT